jgi:hypothetical protein
MNDWRSTIEAIRRLSGELSRAEPHPHSELALPEGATLRAVAAVERRIRCRLPPSYRAFLHAHDGWPSFLAGAPLFGTRELGRGEDAAVARAVFGAYETPIPEIGPPARPRGRSDAMIPFGMDPNGTTIFAWNPAVVRENGEMEVIVWVNGLGDRCEGFPAFLVLARDMIESELADRRHDLRRSA